MKTLSVFGVLALAIALAACGGASKGSQTSNLATGSWSESLAASSGQQLGSLSFSMMQNGTTLTGSNMNFSNISSFTQCFGAGTVMSGQMGAGMMNGGSVTMTMSWSPSGSSLTNTLTMQGTMASGMGSGSGTFTLVGQTSGCTSQSGTFTMTHMGMM